MEGAIRRFIDYIRLTQSRAENTILAYKADLGQFRQVIRANTGRDVAPSELTQDLVRGYVDWLTGQMYKPATISRKMAATRSFLTYLSSQEGISVRALVSELRAPPTPKRRPRVLSVDEITSLLALPAKGDSPRDLRDAALLALLYATGLRAGEAVSLRVLDVDLLNEQVTKPSRTGARVPLGIASEPVRRYLREGRPHLLRRPDEQALFLNQRGQRLSRQGIWLVVKRWVAQLGLGDDVSPHTLRHSLAHHLLNEGKSRREVQRVLGLASPSAIRVYPSPVDH